MLSGSSTQISSQYHQLNVGGDKAALIGVCKALFELDDEARKAGRQGILDRLFIADHTDGFKDFEAGVRSHDWPELEVGSGPHAFRDAKPQPPSTSGSSATGGSSLHPCTSCPVLGQR
jgi:hypothetical protein